MKTLLGFLVVGACGVLLAMGLIHYNPGVAVFLWTPYRVEMSLSMLLLLLLVAFTVLYALTRLLVRTLELPADVREYRRRRREGRAFAMLAAALRAWFEGRYAKAEKAAASSVAAGVEAGLAALVAAQSAHRLRDFERRDSWLKQITPGEDANAALMLRAELLADEHRFDEAMEVVALLEQRGPKHIAAARIKLLAAQAARDWEAVLRWVNLLGNRDALPPLQVEQLRRGALLELLRQHNGDLKSLEQLWRRIPATDRLDLRIVTAAAHRWRELGAAERASEILVDRLEESWQPELLAEFAACAGASNATRLLEPAERWLKQHAREAELLLALGHICVAAELWGKAETYYDASLAIAPSRATHLAIARMAERLQRHERAQKHYKFAAIS